MRCWYRSETARFWPGSACVWASGRRPRGGSAWSPPVRPVMARSFDAGRVVESSQSDTFADGMAVRVAIPVAVEALATAADEMAEVTDREIAEAVGAFAEAGMRVEGSAAAALAGARRLEGRLEGVVVLIVTGRNIDDDLWQRAVERPESFPG